VTEAGLLTPIVAGPGLVTAVVLFGFLLVALLRGE
jgi:K+-transporting ATPase KdpF subunit